MAGPVRRDIVALDDSARYVFEWTWTLSCGHVVNCPSGTAREQVRARKTSLCHPCRLDADRAEKLAGRR